MQKLNEKVNVGEVESRRKHNLGLAFRLAQFAAIHPCVNKTPLAKRHTELDTEIDRAAAIKELKAKHAREQARLPVEQRVRRQHS